MTMSRIFTIVLAISFYGGILGLDDAELSVTKLKYGVVSVDDFLHDYHNLDIEARRNVDSKLKLISIHNNLEKITDKLMLIVKNDEALTHTTKILSQVRNVEGIFENYENFHKTYNEINGKISVNQEAQSTFVKSVLLYQFYGVESSLYRIRDEIAAPIWNDYDYSLIDDVIKYSKNIARPCDSRLTENQLLQQLLGYFVALEVKGLLSLLLAQDVMALSFSGNSTTIKEYLKLKSSRRYASILKKFKQVAASTSDEMHTCDPPKHEEGLTYVQMGIYFNDDMASTRYACMSDCSVMKKKQPKPCESDDSFLKSHCQSVASCFLEESRMEFTGYPKLCISDQSHLVLNTSKKCSYCDCRCESDKEYYRISLDRVLSRIDQNYVVTGGRLVVKDKIMFIQLQEGKLLSHGLIDPDTVRWIDLPSEPTNYTTMHLLDSSFYMGSQIVPDDNFVTGASISVKKVDNFNYGYNLNVLYSPVDINSGNLDGKADPILMSKDDMEEGHPMLIIMKDLPIKSYDNDVDSENGDYLYLRRSLKYPNFTFPFIDVQDVSLSEPGPLSGLGFVHKGTETSAGFLGLNLHTYNVVLHLSTYV